MVQVYNGTALISELAMNWQFLDKIWRPDTFFLNGKDSYLHKIAVPNRLVESYKAKETLYFLYDLCDNIYPCCPRFIRIAPDGGVSFSQRLTISAKCRMHLQKFPLDSQNCPLEIGSFGHPNSDLQYKWAVKPLRLITYVSI